MQDINIGPIESLEVDLIISGLQSDWSSFTLRSTFITVSRIKLQPTGHAQYPHSEFRTSLCAPELSSTPYRTADLTMQVSHLYKACSFQRRIHRIFLILRTCEDSSRQPLYTDYVNYDRATCTYGFTGCNTAFARKYIFVVASGPSGAQRSR